jgi:uncharacterized membrane protein
VSERKRAALAGSAQTQESTPIVRAQTTTTISPPQIYALVFIIELICVRAFEVQQYNDEKKSAIPSCIGVVIANSWSRKARNATGETPSIRIGADVSTSSWWR